MKAKGEKEYKEYLSQLKTKMSEIKTQTEQETGQIWSDVMQNDKCFYIGYHRAGELASIAVDEAGKYYKLRVPLTAGYTLGRNWAETH